MRRRGGTLAIQLAPWGFVSLLVLSLVLVTDARRVDDDVDLQDAARGRSAGGDNDVADNGVEWTRPGPPPAGVAADPPDAPPGPTSAPENDGREDTLPRGVVWSFDLEAAMERAAGSGRLLLVYLGPSPAT
ncbi:MAG: hypothetical protein ACYTG6_17615 [Planctomycetota bacterium]|jgi:hypothetical protein